jgi:hypothetical protein
MNIYTATFCARCPVNGAAIWYTLRIETSGRLLVETLQSQLEHVAPAFHEDIADAMLEKFGGQQTMTATHHGVQIETRRGGV